MFERSDAAGYIACCEAVKAFDFREKVGGVRVPTLVIAGTHDPATTLGGYDAWRIGFAGSRLRSWTLRICRISSSARNIRRRSRSFWR